MIIGTVRAEESRAYASDEGYHQFHNEEGDAYGSFEVFWHDGGHMAEADEGDDMSLDDWRDPEPAGWYWIACFPGCVPDGEVPSGPFASSGQAREDADEYCNAGNGDALACRHCGANLPEGVTPIGQPDCPACGRDN